MGRAFFRRKMGGWGYRFQKYHGRSFFAVLLAAAAFFGVWSWYGGVFTPVLGDLCEAKANRIGQEVIHRSVAELLSREEFLGDRFLRVEKSEEGEPALVLPDTMVMNRFRSELTLLISNRLNEMGSAPISIPLGNLSGMEFLSNRGPNLTVDAYPYGEVFVEMFSEFSQAGVNQTRHAMSVRVVTDISMALPGQSARVSRVVATVPMSETVVVGMVPNSYTNLETEKESLKSDLMNLIDE